MKKNKDHALLGVEKGRHSLQAPRLAISSLFPCLTQPAHTPDFGSASQARHSAPQRHQLLPWHTSLGLKGPRPPSSSCCGHSTGGTSLAKPTLAVRRARSRHPHSCQPHRPPPATEALGVATSAAFCPTEENQQDVCHGLAKSELHRDTDAGTKPWGADSGHWH